MQHVINFVFMGMFLIVARTFWHMLGTYRAADERLRRLEWLTYAMAKSLAEAIGAEPPEKPTSEEPPPPEGFQP